MALFIVWTHDQIGVLLNPIVKNGPANPKSIPNNLIKKTTHSPSLLKSGIKRTDNSDRFSFQSYPPFLCYPRPDEPASFPLPIIHRPQPPLSMPTFLSRLRFRFSIYRSLFLFKNIFQICFAFFLLAAKKQLSFLYLLYEEVLS